MLHRFHRPKIRPLYLGYALAAFFITDLIKVCGYKRLDHSRRIFSRS